MRELSTKKKETTSSMKNDEVAEIFDEVDVDLMLIQDQLATVIEWIETGRVGGFDFDSYIAAENSFKTPLEYLKFTRDRIDVTRDFFKDWRASKKV